MSNPGKFEGCASQAIGEKLYALLGDGGAEEEFGSVSETGWFGLMTGTGIKGAKHVICAENSDGFFDYETFRSAKAARARFATLAEELDQNDEQEEGTES